MKSIASIAALALLLCGCTTFFTPQRCEQAAAGLATAAQIAQVLIDYGIEPARAHKLADAVAAGRILVAAACAQAGEGGGS
jgi:PBP1b-binding outer membrane lipoprotein LpoB